MTRLLFLFLSISLVYGQRLRHPKLGCRIDILFVLDASGSVGNDFEEMRDFISMIANRLNVAPDAHHVAFLEYSTFTEETRHLKAVQKDFGDLPTQEDFLDFIDNELRYISGLTHTGRAIERAIEMLKKARKDSLKLVLFLTDGFYHDEEVVKVQAPILNSDPERTLVFCLALPLKYNREKMITITGSPDRVIHFPHVSKKVIRQLGPHLSGKDFQCQKQTTSTTTTTTTTTTTQKPNTGCEVDLLFIFDFSTSVEQIHNKYIEEAVKIIDGMTISPYHTRVSMVKYSSRKRHEIVFHFDKHKDAQGVINDMRNAYYNGGTTWTGAAIRLAMTEFDEKYGARLQEATHQVVVLYTDGYSQEDPKEAAEQLRAMSGLEVYVVALSQADVRPDENQLQDIAGDTDNVFLDKNDDLARKLASYNRNCRG